jgi:hypothetical protein
MLAECDEYNEAMESLNQADVELLMMEVVGFVYPSLIYGFFLL